MPKNIIIIAGGSASGKSSIAQLIVESEQYIQYKPLTTRSFRPAETVSDYRHISDLEFKEIIQANGFVFWDYLFDNYYGVDNEINDFLKKNEKVLIILPAWRVEDLLKLINYQVFIFHFVTECLMTLERRLNERNSVDIKARIEDVIRQNDIVLPKAIRIDESLSLDEICNFIVTKINSSYNV